MTVRRLHTDARMSQAVVAGGLVHLSGQVSSGDGVAEQTQGCLDEIDALLAEAGTSREHAVSATIWLADISEFDAMNGVWESWVIPGQAPARATVEARLARSDLLVEIALVAAIPAGEPA